MKASPELLAALDDARFPNMSGKMRGILRYILGRDDGFAELCVTSDGFLLGRLPDDCGCNEFLGTDDDFRRNYRSLLDAAGLTHEQRLEAVRLTYENMGLKPGEIGTFT